MTAESGNPLVRSLPGHVCTVLFLLLAARPAPLSALTAEFPQQVIPVKRPALVAAMQREKALGYNLRVSTTASRFTTAVLLDLAEQAYEVDPDGAALAISGDDWFEAYRETLGIDSQAVPPFVALQREHRQYKYVDYARHSTQVEVTQGPTPRRALHVRSGWADSAGAASEYRFVDTAADPDMEVTNERVISYWLLDFGTFFMQDHVSGLRGRPLSGALGAAFYLVGSGQVRQSRFAVTSKGDLVSYSCAEKGPFSVHLSSTTYVDGRLRKGIDGGDEMKKLESLLKEPLAISYPKE